MQDFRRGLDTLEKLRTETIERVETGKEGGGDVNDSFWRDREGLLRIFLRV